MVFNRNKNKEGIFREESLEKLSSPERLDMLMKVVNHQDWLLLLIFGGLTAIGSIWSIVGRIPINIEGKGVLIQPRRIVDLQSSIPGQLKTLEVKNGECIKKNRLIATIEPVEIKQQLDLTKQKLGQLQLQANNSSAVSERRMQLEQISIVATRNTLIKRLEDSRLLTPQLKAKGLDAIKEQESNLRKRLKDTQGLTPVLKEQGLSALKQQRISLEQRLKDAKSLVPILAEKLKKRHDLIAAGAIAAETALQIEQEYKQGIQAVSQIQTELKQLDLTATQTQQSYLQNLRSMGEIQVQMQQLVADRTKTEREYLDNLRSISDMQGQLQELNTKEKRLSQETLETKNSRNREIQDVNREIVKLEQQLKQNSEIVSTQDGCILELTATVGQVVQPGAKLGNLHIGDSRDSAMTIAYFPIKDGKQIRKGMSISVTPDTVQRERYGGINGKITEISDLPVTKEGAVSLIGNQEVVSSLIGQGGAAIQVNADLISDLNSLSGYKWSSSKGPDSKITPGTTTSVRVTIEERAPITFVLPILKELVAMK
jgi:HlyD family secretion protein